MTSIGRWIDAIRRFWGRGVCPHELSFTLTLGLRRLILTPETLVERLELAPDDVVLELGPGPGYFSPTVAQALPQGSLLLLDIQRPMLEKASLRVEQVAPTGRTVAVQGDAGDLPVANASVDVAFLVAVLGETTDPGQTMVEIARVLRPGGKLAITEQPGDPDAMEDTVVRALAEDAGLVYLNRHGSRKNFTVTFVRPMGDLPHASALDS